MISSNDLNNIILLLPGLNRAGQEKVVYELAVGFKDNGHNVEVVSFYDGPYKFDLENQKIKVHILCHGLTKSVFSKILLLKNFINLIIDKRNFYFIFHGIGYEKLWIISKLLILKLPKSIFVFHNNYSFIDSGLFNSKKIKLKIFLGFIDKIIFIQKNIMLNSLKFRILKSNSKIKVIHNGIRIPKKINNSSDILKLKSSLGFNFSDRILIQVGRFADQKNQFLTIQSFELILNRFSNLKLIFLGHGKHYDKCINYVNSKNLNDKIFFQGNVDNVYDYLNISEIFLMPSEYEGHPIALIEAFMLQIPSIVFNSPGINDFLPPKLDCLNYVKHKTKEDYSKTIISVLEKNDLNKNEDFISACNWVITNYSNNKMVNNYIDFLN